MSTKHPMTLFLSARQKKWFSVSCILILIFIAINFAFPTQASAEAAPGGNIHNTVVRAVDIDKPAIVRIITTLNGSLTVHFPNQTSATFPLNGGKYKLVLSGSGAFISSHGDILTADHVVQPPHDASTDNTLQSLASEDVANYINQNFTLATPVTSDDVYASLIGGVFPSDAHYDTPTSEVYLSTDYSGLINAFTMASIPQYLHAPVDKIEGSSPVDKNDVAIVHVKMEDTPSIRLGDSSNVAEQDNLTIIGFPGNGDLGDPDNPDPTAYLTSSINQIYVSSIKLNSNGGTLIQVGGNVEHGDSGGPALDNNGNIVGIVSFLNQDGDSPIGTSFLQASSSAQDITSTLSSLDLAPGKFQKEWEQAFTQYTSTSTGHWHKADSDFLAIQQNYPAFQVVASFKSYTSEQAKHENLQKSSSQPPYLLLLLLLVVIIIILALTWFLLSRRKKNQLATAAAAQSPMFYASNTPPAPNFYNPSNYIHSGNYTDPGNQVGATNFDTLPQPTGNETSVQRSADVASMEQVAPLVDNKAIIAEANGDGEEQIPTVVTANEGRQTPTVETDFDASVPLIAPDTSKHINPYAPQPISWQAFQELATHNPAAAGHEPEPYQRREEPTIYEPMSEERTEPSQPTRKDEDIPFWSKPNQSTNERKQDSTDKHPKY